MTQHTACYETLGARFTAAGSHRPDSAWKTRLLSVDPTETAPPGLLFDTPLVPPSGFKRGTPPWTAGKVVIHGDTDIWYECLAESDWVSQDGAAFDNGAPGIQSHAGDINWNTGRIAPNLEAVLPLPANPTGAEGQATMCYIGETYQGLAHFCEFEDHPPNNGTDGSAALTALLLLFDQAVNTYTVGNDGSNDIVVNGCGFAAVTPNGAIFIEPTDIGPGLDQIPTDSDQNTASRFRAHPGVFYPAGMTQYVRAITRQAVDDFELNFDVAGGPIAIWQVDSAPENSDWLVCVDSQYQVIRLDHPEGSDYRRPRDIWNNVWQPIINAGGAVSLALIGRDPSGTSAAVGTISTRWKYANYFRCLKVPDTTNIPQGGGA